MTAAKSSGVPARRSAIQSAGETIEQIETVTLDDHEGEGDQPGNGNADRDWNRNLQVGSQIDQQNEAQRRVGYLGEEFESEIDDRGRRRDHTRYPGQADRASAEDAPPHLGQR